MAKYGKPLRRDRFGRKASARSRNRSRKKYSRPEIRRLTQNMIMDEPEAVRSLRGLGVPTLALEDPEQPGTFREVAIEPRRWSWSPWGFFWRRLSRLLVWVYRRI